MKKSIRTLFASTLLLGVIGLATSLNAKQNKDIVARATEVDFAGRAATSGSNLYVNGGGTYFNTTGDNTADLAIYCFNSDSDNAWSPRFSYRCYNDYIRVVIPYQNGVSKTWAKFIVCRYNPGMNPESDGWSGVYNQSRDIGFSEMMYYHNTVNITGWDDGNGKLQIGLFSSNKYCGIYSLNHIYLDLSNFTDWESDNAKFGLYFAYPLGNDNSGWSQSYYTGSYTASFLWKVQGQDNDHLYEGVVPNGSNGKALWNMVIAVRFKPEASEPSWNNMNLVWNQTQNLSFNPSNHDSNIIRISSWNEATLLDPEFSISKTTRINFYGQYFLDTVTCSGTGNGDTTTSAMWESVKDAYHKLSDDYQGDVWLTKANKNGTIIQQAMARYDYIVLYKQYDHEDFINRADPSSGADHSISSPVIANNFEDNDRLTLIIILASMMTLSAVALIVLKKYKSRRR